MPLHGFIGLTAWEKSIVDSPIFQRLRRIRQLAWTDLVYPGAMHTRFEHSLGVMHVASQMFDAIRKNSEDVLKNVYKYDDHGLAKERLKIRLAALLHDVGHSPFSHGSEDLFPFRPLSTDQEKQLSLGEPQKQKRYKHEDYSYALIRYELRTLIEDHESNRNYNIKADEIADLLQGSPRAGASLLWREILDHQLDADRMDYLLRDSHHLGVNYGKYDLHRLVGSVCAYESLSKDRNSRSVRIGVLSGGLHAAESLVIARYWMFKQVYQHKTRVAFDIHLKNVMENLLGPAGLFPSPSPENLEEYTRWDDWKVQGLLAEGKGGPFAAGLSGRGQLRQVYSSEDRLITTGDPDLRLKAFLQESANSDRVFEALADMNVIRVPSSSTWYKEDAKPISVVNEADFSDVRPLTQVSPIASFNAFDQVFLYVPPEFSEEARLIAEGLSKEFRAQRYSDQQFFPESELDSSVLPVTVERKEISSVPTLKLVSPGKEEANGR